MKDRGSPVASTDTSTRVASTEACIPVGAETEEAEEGETTTAAAAGDNDAEEEGVVVMGV